jgi:hypothetical protein
VGEKELASKVKSPDMHPALIVKAFFGSPLLGLVTSLILGGMGASGVFTMMETHVLFIIATICAVIGIVTAQVNSGKGFWTVLIPGILTLLIVGAVLYQFDIWLGHQREMLDALIAPAKVKPPAAPIGIPKYNAEVAVTGNSNVTVSRSKINQQSFGQNSPNVIGNAPVPIAPNGIANVAPNLGTQSVYNFEPPAANVTYSSREVSLSDEDKINPLLKDATFKLDITIKTDRTLNRVAFQFVFDGAFIEVTPALSYYPGMMQIDVHTNHTADLSKYLYEITLNHPATMPATGEINLFVFASKPIKILQASLAP